MLVCLLIASTFPMIDTSPAAKSGCWETWSRCTRWSSPATGILWQSCNDRCKCLGRGGGNCVEVNARCSTTGKAYQCQCYGSYGGKTKWWCGLSTCPWMKYIVLKMVKRLLWDYVSKQRQFLRIIWYYFKAILKDNILSYSVF